MVFLLAMVSITGTGFADGGNSVLPPTHPFSPPNNKPNISVSDTNVLLFSRSDSVKIRLLASDPDGDRIKVEKISGMGTFIPKTQLSPVSVIFSFRPDTNGIYTFIFRATDDAGATDQDTARITITYNLPPQLTCPNTQTHHMNGYYTISQVVADDFDGTISSLSAFFTGTGITNLTLINIQGIGTNHVTANVKYNVTDHCAAGGFVYVTCTDNIGAADTCFFGINLTNTAPAIICPSNDSVHAGVTFVSTNFSATDPDGDSLTVTILSIFPSVVNQPTIVASHVNWVTTCSEKGTYTIRLRATDPCEYKDTCEFTVNVYNQPPEIVDSLDTVIVRNQTRFKYYPNIIDPDDSVHVISYPIFPHWCLVENDSVVGIAPDTVFRESLIVVVQDPCNAVDTLAFLVVVYLCGDCNGDGVVNIGDIVWEINYIFKGGLPPQPYAAGDVNCDGVDDVADVVYLINYLFKGGPEPCLNCP